MTRIVTLTLLALLPLCAADQVVLTNGDTITGTIVKKDGDKLTIKSEFLGEVSMPWTSVKTLKSDAEVFDSWKSAICPTPATPVARLEPDGFRLAQAVLYESS